LHTGQRISRMPLSYPIPRALASAVLASLLALPVPAAGGIREEWQAAPIERKLTLLEEYRAESKPDALAFLIELLRYPDIRVKMASANALRQWGPEAYPALFACFETRETAWLAEAVFVDQEKRATPFLTRQITSLLPTSRARAASVLGKSRDPQAVPPLLSLLSDPVRDVRIQAILGLGEAQDERAIEPLLKVFAEGDPLLTEYSIQALEDYGWQGARKLREALRSPNPRMRNGAVQVLRRLRVPESLPDLVAALEDGSSYVRLAAVNALGQFRGQNALEGLMVALNDESDDVAAAAVSALSGMGPEVGLALLPRLTDPEPRVRCNVVRVLRQAGGATAVPSLIQFLNDPDEAVRTYAVTSLMELKDPRSVKPLVERLKKEEQIQWLIAYALQAMAEECADELLSAVGNDQFCYTRNIILLRMGERAQEVLVQRAQSGEGTSRLTAIALLGMLGDPAAVPVLEKLLPDPDVGLVAGGALGNLKGPGWEILLAQARSPEGSARRNALGAIGGAGATAAADVLTALSDPDDSVRVAAVRALDRMGTPMVAQLVSRLPTLSEEGFEAAIGVLCRISDPGASGALMSLLCPPRGKSGIDQERFDRLRVAYAVRGSLSNLREQMKIEMTGGPALGR
jgi:HEAT repeat protein